MSALHANRLLRAASCPADHLGSWEARDPGKGRTCSSPHAYWTVMQILLCADGRQSLQGSRAPLVGPSELHRQAQ